LWARAEKYNGYGVYRGHDGALKPVRKTINRAPLTQFLKKSKLIQQFSSLREILLSRVRRSKEGRSALYGKNFPSSREVTFPHLGTVCQEEAPRKQIKWGTTTT
jgi:hypothetical protein